MCFGRPISLDPGRHDGEGSYQEFSDRNASYFVIDQLTGGDDDDGDAEGSEDSD